MNNVSVPLNEEMSFLAWGYPKPWQLLSTPVLADVKMLHLKFVTSRVR